MESVAVFPVVTIDGIPAFRAVARQGQSEGRTVGEALDALGTSVDTDNGGTVVFIQPFRADSLFTAAQRERLQELMSRWRAARDSHQSLSAHEETELQFLIDAELQAADERTRQILKRLEE